MITLSELKKVDQQHIEKLPTTKVLKQKLPRVYFVN